MARLMKVGCTSKDIAVCLLKVLLRERKRFAPVGRSPDDAALREQIVDLLNIKTGLKLSSEDREVKLAINRVCVKLRKFGRLEHEKVVQDKVFDTDATIWGVFWISDKEAKLMKVLDTHYLIELPDLTLPAHQDKRYLKR